MKKIISALLGAVSLLVAASCDKSEIHHKGEYEDVFIYLGLGYNNLSPSLMDDYIEMQEGIMPGKSRDEAFLVYMHNTKTYGDYHTDTPAYLIQVYRESGQTRLDTLKTYKAEASASHYISAQASSVKNVLLDVQELFPSRHYGMMFSSHGTGWLPEGYLTKPRVSDLSLTDENGVAFPATKSVGAQSIGQGNNMTTYEIDIMDLADAIPFKMDYIIFDACLMGCVEVAWQLKDKCDMLLFSPAEILTQGFKYSTLSWNLFSAERPDLKAVANDYFDTINSQSGYSQSATVTLLDCRELYAVADSFRAICSSHESYLSTSLRNTVQPYFYDSKRYFYDLRDYAKVMGASEDEMKNLNEALED
ncbi:MAG TPA: hypothetical protein DCW53_00985, partial [Rikenellaceae bacterium]|nr:hypothetical protein [Rikenellaceae bacterium]